MHSRLHTVCRLTIRRMWVSELIICYLTYDRDYQLDRIISVRSVDPAGVDDTIPLSFGLQPLNRSFSDPCTLSNQVSLLVVPPVGCLDYSFTAELGPRISRIRTQRVIRPHDYRSRPSTEEPIASRWTTRLDHSTESVAVITAVSPCLAI